MVGFVSRLETSGGQLADCVELGGDRGLQVLVSDIVAKIGSNHPYPGIIGKCSV